MAYHYQYIPRETPLATCDGCYHQVPRTMLVFEPDDAVRLCPDCHTLYVLGELDVPSPATLRDAILGLFGHD